MKNPPSPKKIKPIKKKKKKKKKEKQKKYTGLSHEWVAYENWAIFWGGSFKQKNDKL
jgi:hypothetical protein